MLDANRLRERASVRGISQAELARRLKMSQQSINFLFSGEAKGSKQLHRIARELATTPAYLTGETDNPASEAPDAPELSRDEWAWVEYWRGLDAVSRDAMVRVVRLLVVGHGNPDPASVHAPRPAYAGQFR